MVNTFSTPDRPAHELAEKHEAEILAVVARKYQIDVADLALLKEQSFESPSKPGSYSFVVLHRVGFYGVNAEVGEDGKLRNTTCTVVEEQ